MKPLVTVITPTYNHERFIAKCIDTVVRQSHLEWEQIIIDDGSTDNTGQVVGQHNDCRIRYVRQRNRGIGNLAASYNRALSLGSGSLIAILEGDDFWPANKLETMVAGFDDPSVVLAFGHTYETDDKGVIATRLSRTTKSRRRLPKEILFNDPVGAATPFLLTTAGQSFVPPSSVLIRRSALEAIGGFQYVPGNSPVDVPTFVRLSRLGKFCYFDQILGVRRIHARSATVQFLDSMTEAAKGFAMACALDPAFGLSPDQQRAVRESWDRVHLSAEFTRGRLCLVVGETKSARRHFAVSIHSRDSYVAAASAVGWIFSWLQTDLEWIAKLAHRPSVS
jgi:hypothetical protein